MRGVYGVSTWADTLIVCTRNGPMFVFDWHTGTLVRSFGGSGPNKLAVATCARVSPDGLLYVCEVDVPRVSVWSPVTGDFLHEFGPSVGFSRPMSIGFSPDGHIIVGDSVVYVVSKEGAVVNRLTGEGALCLMSPYDTVVAGGKLYMLEHANGRVQVFE